MILDLRDNISLWGPPPSARQVLERLDPDDLARYPDPDGGRLVPALARHVGVAENTIATGCGSDELIDLALRLAEPGGTITYPAPTFSMVPRFAAANRLQLAPVLCVPDRPIDVGALCDPAAAVVYLCSPNNPLGGALPEHVVRAVLARASGLVILDQAYAEFAGEPDYLPAILDSGRGLVTRTFSKAWGLAGLRIGYAIGAPGLIARLRASRGPYSVNAVAEAVALAALEEDAAWVRARAREVAEVRARLVDALRDLDVRPFPSSANFVLIPVEDAAALADRLLASDIAVRTFLDLPGIGDAIRVGLGPWRLMERFLGALAEARACA